jgi:hypothetical protein
MSKTNNMRDDSKGLRWQLLVTVSAAALLASSYGAEAANEDSDRPLLWIELGGQLDQLSNKQETLAPPFMGSITQPGQLSALDVQRPTAFAIDAEGKISFQPEDSNWVFSAAVRYGRSQRNRANHQQTKNPKIPFDFNFCSFGYCSQGKYGSFYPSSHVKFADGRSSQNERHLILDFEAGKDVGLGRFGEHGSSVISAGVRIAQLNSKSNVALRAEPDVNYPSAPLTTFLQYRGFGYNNSINFHDYAASETATRSFHGIGPKVSWDASATIAGSEGNGEITLDWGLNAAVLFGRQEAEGHHQTTVKTYHMTHFNKRSNQGGPYDKVGYFGWGDCGCQKGPISQQTNVADINRARSVTVPNFGGFAGLSFRYTGAKISLGYRADFFVGAIDGGIDTRKSENRGFFGPFASVSVGLGG